MAQGEGSDDQCKTVNLIDFNSSFTDFGDVTARGVLASVRKQRSLLDQTILEEKSSPEKRNGAIETNGNSDSAMVDATPKAQEGEETIFFRKIFIERQMDMETLVKSMEEVVREKLALQQQRRQVLDQLVDAKRHLAEESKALDEQRAFHDLECAALQEEMKEREERQTEQFQEKLDELSALISALTAERDEANKQCEILFLQMHALQKEAGKVERLEKVIQCLQEQLDELHQQPDESEQKSASFVQPLENEDDAMRQMVGQVELLKSANAELETKLRTIQEQLADFQSASQEQMAFAEDQMNKKDAEIEELEEKLSDTNERLRLWKESVETTQVEYFEKVKEASEVSEVQLQAMQRQLAAEKQRAAHLEERVVALEKTCDDADASEAEYQRQINLLTKEMEEIRQGQQVGQPAESKDKLSELEKKYRAAKEEIRRLRCIQENYANGQMEESNGGGDAPSRNDSGNNALFSARSGIMETGRTDMLEAEKYQLRKMLDRTQKEKRQLEDKCKELLDENHQLKIFIQSEQSDRKENDSTYEDVGSERTLRRAVSDCDTSTRRPLQAAPIPNSPAGQLFTSASQRPSSATLHVPRLFRPIPKK